MNQVYKTVAISAAIAMLAGCSSPSASNNVTATSSQANQQYIQAHMNVSVSLNGTVIYSDTAPSGSTLSSLNLLSGTTYDLNLTVTGAPTGTTYQLTYVNTDLINPPANPPITLTAGDNQFTVPVAGDYALTLTASAPNYNSEKKSYEAVVVCPSPTFTKASLNAAAISATLVSPNIYLYNALGVTADANGMAPYFCGWDPTGTGIVDTGFSQENCTAPGLQIYDNYVLNRNVGLVVKDSCNISYAISNSQNLPYTIPSSPGNVFIQGTESNSTGQAINDPRVDGATYFASNTANNKIVTSQYGNGNFTIYAAQNYGMSDSVNFGMEIKVTGLVETTPINPSTQTGAISAANASIASVSFVTDEAGDQAPSVKYSGTNCTTTGLNAQVLFVAGQPCTGGTTGDQNTATVEVWGTYSCTLNSAGGSITFTGKFDGYWDDADSCTGGGQGGGGVPPPGF